MSDSTNDPRVSISGSAESPGEKRPGDHAPGQIIQGAGSGYDPRAELKKGLEATRLPPDLKEQFLAELPPAEEMERLFRELQEDGGLSSEQFFRSLGI